MGANEMDYLEDEESVTLTLDDGTEVVCSVIGIFEAGSKEYIALLPNEGEDAEEGQVYLYRYSETEYGDPILEDILDDEEFEIANDAFDELLDAMEFDELVEE